MRRKLAALAVAVSLLLGAGAAAAGSRDEYERQRKAVDGFFLRVLYKVVQTPTELLDLAFNFSGLPYKRRQQLLLSLPPLPDDEGDPDLL
ncbi:MAG: hypothetical protein ACE5JJ_04380 [Nitrospinota bacterium]